ncbi:MAG: 30S ribosomal protein S6 [Deltaproteobacteria bacterium]|nr:30S ribosomal protein S6 [Deltaproteobacteria bacterium]
MRRYETVFIVNPELSEDQHQLLFDKLNGLVPEDQGMLVKLDEWGNKRLAYEIKKHTRGYYVLMDFCGDGALVKEIERNLRLDDRVLKYMTVLKDETVDLEALKAEMEAAEKIEAAKKEAATVEATKKEAATAEAAKKEAATPKPAEVAEEAATPEPAKVAEEAATPEPAEVAEEATSSEPAEIATGEGEEGAKSEATDAEETPADEAEVPEKTAETSNQEEQ